MPDRADISDAELAARSQKGSLDALETLVERHQARLFHFLCQKAPTRQDAKDMAQHTFINAWQRIHQYRTDASFATWLYTIARNLTISHYRKHGRVTLTEIDTAESQMVDHETPSDKISTTEQQEAIWETARQALKPDTFDVICMKYREHLSITEIARAMQRTETSVKVMLHRARKTLGRALEAEEKEASGTNSNPDSLNHLNQQIAYTQGGTQCSA